MTFLKASKQLPGCKLYPFFLWGEVMLRVWLEVPSRLQAEGGSAAHLSSCLSRGGCWSVSRSQGDLRDPQGLQSGS